MTDRVIVGVRALLALVISASITSAVGAELTTKPGDKEAPAEVDASIRGVLQPKPIQVLGGGKPVLEFWLRKEVPLQSKPASAAKAMEAIKQATLLGVVSVPANYQDYRDDTIAAGTYTMRFALQPQDGNHLGTAEFQYFAVLTPVKLDSKLDGITDYKQLVKASSKETSTDHPVIVSLRPPSGEAGDSPKIVEPAAEHKSILLKVPGKAGAETAPIAFEIVVEGKGHK